MGQLDGWRFCPRCGSSLRNDGAEAVCDACGFVSYANSAPAVQALVVRAGRVLLVRRDRDPGKGRWDLPGGFLDEGEDPVAGLRRELFEETGLEIEPVEYLGAFVEPYFNRHVLGLTWLVSARGDARPADDVAEVQWFAADGLPAADEFQFAHHPRLLAAWAEQVGPPEPQVEPIGP